MGRGIGCYSQHALAHAHETTRRRQHKAWQGGWLQTKAEEDHSNGRYKPYWAAQGATTSSWYSAEPILTGPTPTLPQKFRRPTRHDRALGQKRSQSHSSPVTSLAHSPHFV